MDARVACMAASRADDPPPPLEDTPAGAGDPAGFSDSIAATGGAVMVAFGPDLSLDDYKR